MKLLPLALAGSTLWLGACSLALDYDQLDSVPAASDAGPGTDAGTTGETGPSATVHCAGAICVAAETCCLDADGSSRCATTSSCKGVALGCLVASDCGGDLVCCGWGRAGGTGSDALFVTCQTRAACGAHGGARVICSTKVSPSCPEATDHCIGTDTFPGGQKCEDATNAL